MRASLQRRLCPWLKLLALVGFVVAAGCCAPPPTADENGGNGEPPPPRDPREPEDETPEDGHGWSRFWAERYAEPPHPRCVPAEEIPEHEGPVEVLWERHYIPGYYRDTVTAVDRSLFLYASYLRKISMETGYYEFLTKSWGGAEGYITAGADGVLYLYCPELDAIDPESMWLLRRVGTGSEAICVEPLALGDGRVLVRSQLGYLTLFAPTEEGDDFEIVWDQSISLRQPEAIRMAYSPEHDIAIVPANNGVTLGVRVADGEVVWRVEGYNSVTDVLLLEGGVFVVYATHRPEDAAEGTQLLVLARTVETGELIATSEPLAYPRSNPPFLAAQPTGERIYLLRNDFDPDTNERFAVLLAFNRELELLWTWRNPHPVGEDSASRPDYGIETHPVVAPDGSVFVSSSNCHVYRIDPDGEVAWSDRHPYPAGRAAMVLDEEGVLYAISQKPTGVTRPGEISLLRAYRTLAAPPDDQAP
jgi:outer membrane protein assembly factor BamB